MQTMHEVGLPILCRQGLRSFREKTEARGRQGKDPAVLWVLAMYLSFQSDVLALPIPPGTLFPPSGMQLWLDASDASTIVFNSNSSNVSQWNDKSGNGRNVFQTSTANQPFYDPNSLNSKNTIKFISGFNTLLSNLTSANLLQGVSGWTIFTVARSTNPTGNQNLCTICSDAAATASRASVQYGQVTNNTVSIRVRRLDADAGANVEASSAFGLVYGYFTGRCSYDNTTGEIYENGVLMGISTTFLTSGITSTDNGSVGLGSRPDGAGINSLDGSIAEVLVYGSALSDGDRLLVEGYLKTKWGL